MDRKVEFGTFRSWCYSWSAFIYCTCTDGFRRRATGSLRSEGKSTLIFQYKNKSGLQLVPLFPAGEFPKLFLWDAGHKPI